MSICTAECSSEASVDSGIPSGVIVTSSSCCCISFAEAGCELLLVVSFAPATRSLSKSHQLSGSKVLGSEHATEALIHLVAPCTVVVTGTSCSTVCFAVALVDEVGIVFFTPLGRDSLSICVSVVEGSPKAVVHGSVPCGVVVALAVGGIVSLSEAGLDEGLIVLLAPRGWCSGEDISCSEWR